MITALGLAANQSSGGEKNCIAYSLFCIFIIIIIIIIIISSSIIISLYCHVKLSLSQFMSFPFCPFLLPIPLGGKGRGERATG